jgi:dUTP pyrophosphatase
MTSLTPPSWRCRSFMDPARTEWRVGVCRLVARAGNLTRATSGSSGYDLASAEDQQLKILPGAVALVRTGWALELPPGLEGQVRSRSGLAARSSVFVLNSPGTIDSDYRGEVKVVLANFGNAPFSVSPGDRIAQLVFVQVPNVCLVAVDELTATERGAGGFGSSGNTVIDSTPQKHPSYCRNILGSIGKKRSGASD